MPPTDPGSPTEALQRMGEQIRYLDLVLCEALIPNTITAAARMEALGDLLSEIGGLEDDDAPTAG